MQRPPPATVRFMAAFTVIRDEIDEMIERLEPCLAVASASESGTSCHGDRGHGRGDRRGRGS
jgi:hypothetical protein